MKIGRNEHCPCGSGKKYKRCCIDKNSKKDESKNVSLEQVLNFLKTGIENKVPNQSKPDQKCRIKQIGIINDDTVLCEFYPYANKSMEIKIEIGFIISIIASFWKDNPHVPQHIRNIALKAFSANNEELMYSISPRNIAELMCEGKSIEWIRNTIFQDNSADHRLALAKQKISEIENALRMIICNVLENVHGTLWWDNCVDNKTKGDAKSAYKNQTGATSSNGNVLISYTYLLKLKKIISDNWSDFSFIFPNKALFENWINDLNAIRREEAHNRPITHDHISNLQQIYIDIFREIGQHYPDAASNYLLENWRSKISDILGDYSEKQKSRSVGREFGLDHNMDIIMKTINDLSEVETRLSSLIVPPNNIDIHNELTDLLQSLKSSFEEMIECTKAGDINGVENAEKKNDDVNGKIKILTEKIYLTF